MIFCCSGPGTGKPPGWIFSKRAAKFIKKLFYMLHQQMTDAVGGAILASLPTGDETMLLP